MSTVCERDQRGRDREVGEEETSVCERETQELEKGGWGELSVFVYTCAGRQEEWSEGFPVEGLTYILIYLH